MALLKLKRPGVDDGRKRSTNHASALWLTESELHFRDLVLWFFPMRIVILLYSVVLTYVSDFFCYLGVYLFCIIKKN